MRKQENVRTSFWANGVQITIWIGWSRIQTKGHCQIKTSEQPVLCTFQMAIFAMSLIDGDLSKLSLGKNFVDRNFLI
jgi:hypothetical protein